MYQKEIETYIKKNPIFFIKEIQDSVGIKDNRKAILNTEISRIEKKGIIKRIAHGLYAVPIISCFGSSLPNEYLIVQKVFLDDDSGYATGPTFLNQIGLSTWMPQQTYIKSNNYRKKIELKRFVINAPRTTINSDNKRYFQLLDCIEDMNKYAIDRQNPENIIYQYIKTNNLDTTKLLLFCKKYYKNNVLQQLFMILEEFYETA